MILTRQDIAKALGLRPDAIDRHVREGLPMKKQAGKRQSGIEAITAAEWYAKHNHVKYAVRLAEAYKTGQLDDRKAVKSAPRSAEHSAVAGFAGTVDAAKSAVDQAKAEYEAASRIEKQVCREHYFTCLDQYRKACKDAAEIDLRRGRTMAVEEVEAAFARVAQTVRSALLSLPNAVAPILEGKQAVDIATELTARIEDCLLALKTEIIAHDKT